MHSFPAHKPGSALLIILLIMAAATTIILASSRAVIDSSRLVSSGDSAQLAGSTARSGLEEGLLRFKNDKSQKGGGGKDTLVDGDYGQGMQENHDNRGNAGFVYSLLPIRRGYSSDCATLLAENVTTYSPDCPYYDLTVRSTFAQTSSSTNYFDFTSRDLPRGKKITLNIRRYTSFQLVPSNNFTGVGRITYVVHDSGGAHTYANQIGPFLVSTGLPITSIDITVDSTNGSELVSDGAYPANQGLRVFSVAAINEPLVMEKGCTSIDVTGYAGGIQRQVIDYICKADTTKQYLYDFGQKYDQNGILQY